MDTLTLSSSPLLPKETNVSETQKLNQSQNEFKEYPFRFWICFFYATSIITINVIYISCSPITKDLKVVYGLSELVISSSALFYLVLYMPFNFPSNYILDKYGIKVGIILGTVLTLVGAWIRIFVNHNFYFVTLGLIFFSISSLF
jgi:MFS transporter, FLVCR family, feline leukemia virus subgroup C receptor-related protein